MSALARIKDAGFEVWLKDNGNIGIKPFNALTPQQLEFLKAHKAEIVKELAASDTTEPDGDRTSEAAYNAKGRFFKWLITREDGTQFFSCAMPRQTLAEVRAQYPDVTHIEPVTGEHYDD